MPDKDFVSFLVDETLKLQKNGEAPLSSLELKLNDYNLSFFKGEYIPQAKMLRFQAPFGSLDVPINWSIFSADKPSGDYTILDKHNDKDCLFNVIKAAWNKPLEKILITHADGFCYLVGLRPGEDVHLHDLLNPQVWLKMA